MAVVDRPVSRHFGSECHDEGYTGPSNPTETLVAARTDDIGHNVSSDSSHILNTLSSDQAPSQTYRRLLPDPFFQPNHHPTRESYSCFLRDSDGRYSGVQVQLALPNDADLPIYVSIPHLGIHGLAFRTGDGRPSRQTSQSAVQAEESPVEQENGQTMDGDGHLGHAGEVDERDGLSMTIMTRVSNIIWPWPVHMVWRYLFRRRV